MAREVFLRCEHKYIITLNEFNLLKQAFSAYTEPDEYNTQGAPYSISNIYYDTFDSFLIRNSLASPKYKEKLRLRAYGTPNEASEVFLEIKKKYKGKVNKRRTLLKLREAYSFIDTGNPPDIKDYMNSRIIKELEYFIKIYSPVPKVCISYDRYAYFDRTDPSLRISFDFNIRTRRENLSLEKGSYGTPLLPEGICIMELKADLAKPLWLTEILTRYGIWHQSFSKYGTEYKKYARSDNFGNTIQHDSIFNLS